MDAVIKISALEFNEELFKKTGDLIKGKDADIVIAVKDRLAGSLGKETFEEYWQRIDSPIKEIEDGKSTTFTMEELEKFVYSDLQA